MPVGVGPGQGAHAEPAEVLHAPCAGHLVTAVQFLGEKPRNGENRTLLWQASAPLCQQPSEPQQSVNTSPPGSITLIPALEIG